MVQAPGGQNSILYLDVVHFFNTSVKWTSVAAQDSCFHAQMSNTCFSIIIVNKMNISTSLNKDRFFLILRYRLGLGLVAVVIKYQTYKCYMVLRFQQKLTLSIDYIFKNLWCIASKEDQAKEKVEQNCLQKYF